MTSASSSQDLNEAEVEQEEDEQCLGGSFYANDVETDHRFEDRHLDYSQTDDKKDLASLHPSALQSTGSRNRIRAVSGQPLTRLPGTTEGSALQRPGDGVPVTVRGLSGTEDLAARRAAYASHVASRMRTVSAASAIRSSGMSEAARCW
jgi:hypothetical protein